MPTTTPQLQALKGRTRRISLEFMGEDWTDAFIDVRYLTWADTKRIREQAASETDDDQAIQTLLGTLREVFVAGRSLNADGQMVDLTGDDLESLDMDALGRVYQATLGVADPKD